MTELDTLLTTVVDQALAALRKARADVYTFVLHHDRMKGAVSVYADSEENSRRVVRELNRASMKRFAAAVRKRDLDEASMWQASVGRNLSLSDFAWPKLGRRPLGKFADAAALHKAILLTTVAAAPKTVAITSDRESLLFACSTPDDDIGLIWTPDAAKLPKPKKARARS